MIIDATDLILGKLASFTAKKILNGEEVVIINAEKAVISGRKENIFEKYKKLVDIGDRFKGPFISKTPDKLLKRAIKGMVPRKRAKGRESLKKLKVYTEKPKNLEGEIITVDKINKVSLKDQKYVTLKDLCAWLKTKGD
ncbi:MAG: 50S ribosomal protein L13 [Candidatus Omnitrophica bacterium]|nr:50S ribosomal protein L13 [Candidatus Omnitrophota bacterium]